MTATLFDLPWDDYRTVEAPAATIQERFEQFHQVNPWVYDALVRLAYELQQRGRRRIGVGLLFEVLRWQHAMATTDPSSEFKLCNDYASRYARLIVNNHPDLESVFELRRLRTK
jgi:hypothetical protein